MEGRLEGHSVQEVCTREGLAARGSMAYVKKFKKGKKASVVRCHKAKGAGRAMGQGREKRQRPAHV